MRIFVPVVCLLLLMPTNLLAQKKKVLFNGKDLSGWTEYGHEKWYVENGDLVCESGPYEQYGYLATDCWYENFILTFSFKQEKNGNSGVFFRSRLEGNRITGWQVEIAPPGNDTGGIYEAGGRGWLYRIPDPKEKILKMGEWNRMKIRVNGNRVTTWLNGKKMADIADPEIGKGSGNIALQIHDGGGIKVRWRDIRLREL